jgi:hypothetical protein
LNIAWRIGYIRVLGRYLILLLTSGSSYGRQLRSKEPSAPRF